MLSTLLHRQEQMSPLSGQAFLEELCDGPTVCRLNSVSPMVAVQLLESLFVGPGHRRLLLALLPLPQSHLGDLVCRHIDQKAAQHLPVMTRRTPGGAAPTASTSGRGACVRRCVHLAAAPWLRQQDRPLGTPELPGGAATNKPPNLLSTTSRS